jgi:phosphoserine aminotransferase
MSLAKPTRKPANPRFSSGPCAKRPGWSPTALQGAALGLSHRSKAGKDKLARVIERSRALLGMPQDYGACWGRAASTCWPSTPSAATGRAT